MLNGCFRPGQFFCVWTSIVLQAGLLSAGTYYVSPHGDDQQAGTQKLPWKTLEKASHAASAGDTIVFLEGTYRGNLIPKQSGRPDKPIVFRAAQRRTVKLLGGKTRRHAIHVEGKSHLQFHGFHIEPDAPKFGRWISITDSDHILVSDVLMENASGTSDLGNTPFVVRDSDQIQIRNSTLQNFFGGDMAHVFNSRHILFEGNAIGHSGHSPLALSPRIELFKGLSDVVIRGNVFFAGWGRPFEIFSERNVLFEDNLIIDAFNGARSAGPEAKMMTENGIVRFNRVYRNWGSPVNLGYYHPKADAHTTRYYHNVFDDNFERAIRIETVRDYLFKNNIFSRNDQAGAGRQVVFRGDAKTFQMQSNVFWAGGMPIHLEDLRKSSGHTLKEVQSERWVNQRGPQFQGNWEIDPGFVDPKTYNHALVDSSPLIDAGDFLTRTTTAGKGNRLPVADAAYFYDGYGIEGETGDTIAVGSSTNQARILDVDQKANSLLLDREITWKNDAPVSLVWSGEKPDIGVYEHGSDGRGSVQIVMDKFQCHPGDEVQLEIVTHGEIKPVAFHWQLGDGSVATAQKVTKSFELLGGYPIRVAVTEADGDVFRACAFIDVVSPNRQDLPLLVTSFDNDPREAPDFQSDAGNWYYVYYKSRPTVDYSIEFEADGNGYARFWADSDDHPLAVTAYPAGWNLDQHPIVRLRYKIDAGLPLTLSIDGFSTLEDSRSVVVADVAGTAPYQLIADDRWHDLTVDARVLRAKYPDIDMLRRFRFEVFQRDHMTSGDGYALDHLEILPDSSPSSP